MAKHFQKAVLITRTISLLIGGLFSMHLYAGTPADFTAEYLIHDGKPISERSLSFSSKGDHYTLRATTRALGIYAMISPDPIVEESIGIIKGMQVKPAHYQRTNKNDPDKNLDLSFNWQSNKVLSKTSPSNIEYAITDHTQDLLSETLAIMLNPPAAMPQKMDLTTRSRPKFYLYEKVGAETVTTQVGSYDTIKYKRSRIGKTDRAVYVWCAPSLANLPVKIEKHKRGKVQTALIKSLNGVAK